MQVVYNFFLGQKVVTHGPARMENCNHEEADTRIMVHLLHALQNGSLTVLVRTVDTDVVVILVGKFRQLKEVQENLDVWVAFGMGKTFSFISINEICHSLGETKSCYLPLFHAISGCDTTSAFYGKGKKSAWEAWELCQDILTPTLEFLSMHPFHHLTTDSTHFKNLERMVVVMYDKYSPLGSVNSARKALFCKNSKAIEKLPPTQVTVFSFK